MSSETMIAIDTIIAKWKSLNIKEAVMDFDCGGDSMNETSWVLRNNKNEEVADSDLVSYLDDAVYKEVQFYENSDGHYIGEFGKVIVILEDDAEQFTYKKDSQSEWNETHTDNFEFELTPEEKKFVETKILNINGGDNGSSTINYKGDFILTDEEEAIAETLADRIDDFARDCEFKDAVGEANDWYNWTTDIEQEDDEHPTLAEKGLMIRVETTFTEIKDENQ